MELAEGILALDVGGKLRYLCMLADVKGSKTGIRTRGVVLE